MPEIAVHTFNSHGVQEMRKKLVVKRACKRRVDAVQNRQLLEQSLTEFIRQAKTQSVAAVSEQNSLIQAMSADTAHSCERRTATLQIESKEHTMRLDRGWLEEGITLAQFISRTPAVAESCCEDPFAKMRDSITDTVNKLRTKAQSEASQTHQRIKETVPRSSRSRVLRFSTRQRESVPGGDAMWDISHSSASCRSGTPSSTWLHGSARQRCAKRVRQGNEQVARRQGAQDCETERDEHPERKGGWNSRCEATRAAWEEHKTFNKASRWGHSQTATGTSTGDNKHRLHQTCGRVNQHRHVCVKKCPLTMRHTA